MSKTLGHALEGYVKGLVQHLCDKKSKGKKLRYEVRRRMPAALSMNCDITVWEIETNATRVLANILVFHSLKTKNSDMKWKRSRQEYIESELFPRRCGPSHTKEVHKHFHTGMVIFCPFWLKPLVKDFKLNLTPSLYVPDHLEAQEERNLCCDVEKLYLSMKGDKTQGVAASVRKKPSIVRGSEKLIPRLESMIWRYRRTRFTSVVEEQWDRLAVSRSATAQPQSINTRFSHGFKLLALFSAEERSVLFALYERSGSIEMAQLPSSQRKVIQKALFLGVVSLRQEGKGDAFRIIFQAKIAVDDLDVVYLLERLDISVINEILDSLMGYAVKYPNPFRGFVSSLRMANCVQIAEHALPFLKCLHTFFSSGAGRSDVKSALMAADGIYPPFGLWRRPVKPVLANWSIAISLAVASSNNRAYTKSFDFGRTEEPTKADAEGMLKCLCSLDVATRNCLVESTIAWLVAWETEKWAYLAKHKVPAMFDIKTPSSWLQWHYNIIVTNHAFQPMNLVAYRELARKEFDARSIYGFPSKACEPLHSIVPATRSRMKLTIAGKSSKKLVWYEGKCITANNWGNKSKELFDRVGDFKRACHAAGVEGEAVLVIDGDFSDEALKELASSEAYDRIYSLDELLPIRDR